MMNARVAYKGIYRGDFVGTSTDGERGGKREGTKSWSWY